MHSQTSERLVQSTPGSPQEKGRPNSIEVIGSADSLVERVSIHGSRVRLIACQI